MFLPSSRKMPSRTREILVASKSNLLNILTHAQFSEIYVTSKGARVGERKNKTESMNIIVYAGGAGIMTFS